MGLREYVIRRLVQMVIAYFMLLTVIFAMFRVLPGDPTSFYIAEGLSPEAREEMLETWGLNEPIHVQYIDHIVSTLTLDFGQSFHYGEPVINHLPRLFFNTIFVMGAAFILAYVVGTIVGTLLGWYRGTDFEKAGIVVTLMARSSPEFWTSILLLMVFVFGLGWFPWGGMGGMGGQATWRYYFTLSFWHHLFLPAVAGAIFYVAGPTLLMRNTMIDTMNEDFIEIKEAEGLSTLRVMFYHAARNSILPVVTLAAIVTALTIGGSIVIEVVFSWPGMGREMVNSIHRNDFPMMRAIFILMGSVVIVMNFIADLAYLYLDPRVKYD